MANLNNKYQDNSEASELAQLRLLRRLKRLDYSGKNIVVDPEYVTCAEYQLFVDELRQQDTNQYPLSEYLYPRADGKWQQPQYYRQPEHWPSYTYTEAESNLPITGVRGHDALDFCEWLNTKVQTSNSGKKPHYRLPTPQEAQLTPLALSQPDLASWCFDEGKLSLVGLSEEFIQQTSQTLLSLAKDSDPPKLKSDFFSTEPDQIIRDGFALDINFSDWDYREDQLLGVREALNVFFDFRDKQDMTRGTNLPVNQIKYIAYYIIWVKLRNLNVHFEVIQKIIIYDKLQISGFNEVTSTIINKNWLEAEQLITQLSVSPDQVQQHWSIVLTDYLNMMKATAFPDFRRAIREHLVHLSWFAYQGYKQLEWFIYQDYDQIINEDSKTQSFERYWALPEKFNLPRTLNIKHFGMSSRRYHIPEFFDFNRAINALEDIKEQIARIKEVIPNLYWQMQLLLARENGQLPAWEGIRLVADYS